MNMEAQNKKSVITWGSYVGVFGIFISAWMTGALEFIDAAGLYWGLTTLQVVFVPLVGIGVGLAMGEGISRVKAGAPLSEYVKAGTEEVEKFLQAGLGTGEDTAKRITGKWTAKAGEALSKLKTSITSSFSRLVHRGEKHVRQARAKEIDELHGAQFPAPAAVLAEFWQTAHGAFALPKAKVRAVTTSKGVAAEVVIFPVQEYNPKYVEPKQAYLCRRTKALIAFAIIVAGAFLTLIILKLTGVMG